MLLLLKAALLTMKSQGVVKCLQVANRLSLLHLVQLLQTKSSTRGRQILQMVLLEPIMSICNWFPSFHIAFTSTLLQYNSIIWAL